ncbi:hypothetical protein [Streptosporangium sp. NPDC002721]|uniref:hypothetical protein n=1 Tax=Streptosporangium sp. NPDC002721 TaxID=3366188 RepID=UPI0036A1BA33
MTGRPDAHPAPHEFTWSTARGGVLFPLPGLPSKNRASTEKTLERLASLTER